jgi:hypothetical protein
VNSTLNPSRPECRRPHRVASRCISARWPWPYVRLFRAIVATFALAGVLRIAGAQQPEPTGVHKEYTVKAVLLYSFGRYVEWPKIAFVNASEPFVIGILGEDLFEGSLDAIAAKKTIQNRRIVIRRFASVATYDQPCHILFVSRSMAPDQQAALIAKTAGKPVFVVGETPGFAEHGGIANFYTEGDRVLFEINVDAARRAQLHMDAKLLSLGKAVGSNRAEAAN